MDVDDEGTASAGQRVARIVVIPGLGIRKRKRWRKDAHRYNRLLQDQLGQRVRDQNLEVETIQIWPLLKDKNIRKHKERLKGSKSLKGHGKGSRWQCKCCRNRSGLSWWERRVRDVLRQPIIEDFTSRIALQFGHDEIQQCIDFFSRPALRSEYRKRIQTAMSSHPDVIIGHSFGSLVALDLLANMPRERQPNLFVTVGTPIGLPGVRYLLQKDHRRWIIHRRTAWLNVHDNKDVVTGMSHLSTSRFPDVVNLRIRNKGNHHSLSRSLRHPATLGVMARFIDGAMNFEDTRTVNLRKLPGAKKD